MYKFGLAIFVMLVLSACAQSVPGLAPMSPLAPPTTATDAKQVSPLSAPVGDLTAPDSPTAPCSLAGEESDAVAALQVTYQLSDDLLLQWYCAGAGLGDIRKAYEVQAQTGQPIEEIFAQFFAGVGWGDISRPAEAETVDPEVQLCLEEHAEHREVLRIAEEFTQPTEILSELFCKGMGFGEIRQAIDIHQETEEPLQKIAALFLESRNWVAIRAELGASPLQGDPTGND